MPHHPSVGGSPDTVESVERLVAYFLTWTTHMSWLHGDERFSIDREHNQRGGSRIRPNALRRHRNRVFAQSDPVVLSDEERRIVRRAIEECAAFRGWKIVALNVRTNHVHCVVQATTHTPERVMTDFKARATRLLREAGLRGPEESIWTKHGSTKWINEASGLRAAADYVLNQQ